MVDADLVESIFGLLQSVTLEPGDVTAASAIIEAVLRARCYNNRQPTRYAAMIYNLLPTTVQIDQNLEARSLCPVE